MPRAESFMIKRLIAATLCFFFVTHPRHHRNPRRRQFILFLSLSRASYLRRLPCTRRSPQQPKPPPVTSGKSTGAASLLHCSRYRGEPAIGEAATSLSCSTTDRAPPGTFFSSQPLGSREETVHRKSCISPETVAIPPETTGKDSTSAALIY